MMHFPELWETDSLIFDDSSERELLIRQFEELIGEISADEGYDLDLTKESFPFLRNKSGKVEAADTTHALEMPTLFRTPTKQHHHHTKRLDSNELSSCKPLDTHPTLGSPLTVKDPASVTMSLRNSTYPDAALDRPGSMAISDILEGTRHDGCVAGTMTSNGPRHIFNFGISRSGSSVTSLNSLSSLEISGHNNGLKPRRLFPPEQYCPKIKATRTHRKRSRIDHYPPNPPRASPRPRNEDPSEIPQDIMKDLAVIRTHRRSSYADGDSLVEVQPSSLPGSPTMFAYRDPEGRLRVPLDMHCNQKALATYRSMTPSSSLVTPRIISIHQQGAAQCPPAPSEALKETLSINYGSQVSPQRTGNNVNHVSQEMTPSSMNRETAHSNKMRACSSSAQTLIKEWEELRQLI